ncbi:MAG TPA: ABC transporter ATP-binding protein [Anaerolineales bacterium]|nr:ABC transporter ATP-binding protein [Anaerolineales bacterium]HMV94692.1 ABC transporter ATP-binding protein [Anaerolineales bacterium]HMX18508.1 ABC transporter ATP-binding protein [Anaerolineales bacterium]HMX72703.1 ABC transporter ATP-binding protein [Anaerolineales bacterium]HMZ43399.1 ABC transporter ATP-binding protein [Anaerolineales bacterium]
MTQTTPSTPEIPLAVEMRGIVKRFPGVLASNHVDFELRAGEIHGLLGENGAGKSTLMNVLAGLYRQEAGIIKVKGKPVDFYSPRDAINHGIGMVHQHFMLVPSQTVTENVLLGLDDPRFFMRLPEYDAKVAAVGERFGLKVDPRAKIWQLSVGEQQRVELLKMLYRGANVLIMDEPTAVLAPQEIDGLFDILRSMIAQGKSVIFISHKLNEVSEIADHVTVLRNGRVTASSVPSKGVSKQELARLMVGRDIVFFVDKKPVEPGEKVLDVKDVHAENDKGLPALRGLSLNVRKGEIVGVAGVAGNGQNELSQVITGLRKCKKGEVFLGGDKVSNRDTLFGIQHGMSYVPEDRTHVGSAPNLSVTDNVIMKNFRKPPISKGGLLDMTAAGKFANELKQAYDIIVPNVNTPVRLLSGGNLQRVILAREISEHPDFMVAVQPTRGLDVGAIEGVHKLLLAQREAGAAVLLISEELDELLGLCDRVYVIYEGKIMGEVPIPIGKREEDLIETIGLMMTGTPLDQIQKEGVGAND